VSQSLSTKQGEGGGEWGPPSPNLEGRKEKAKSEIIKGNRLSVAPTEGEGRRCDLAGGRGKKRYFSYKHKDGGRRGRLEELGPCSRKASGFLPPAWKGEEKKGIQFPEAKRKGEES